MSLEKFLNKAVSSWMSAEGPESDIILSSRIRLSQKLCAIINFLHCLAMKKPGK